jgi:hypothetical protein
MSQKPESGLVTTTDCSPDFDQDYGEDSGKKCLRDTIQPGTIKDVQQQVLPLADAACNTAVQQNEAISWLLNIHDENEVRRQPTVIKRLVKSASGTDLTFLAAGRANTDITSAASAAGADLVEGRNGNTGCWFKELLQKVCVSLFFITEKAVHAVLLPPFVPLLCSRHELIC